MKKTKKAVILLVDNESSFLNPRREVLEQEGYSVIPATNPTEARRLLEQGGIDLAILDIRLIDDEDGKDISGITLAKEVAISVPKIILTRHPEIEYVREALRLDPDIGISPASNFIYKDEGVEQMLRTVSEALLAHSPARQRNWLALVLAMSGALVFGIVAIVLSEPSWLFGTVALGIVYAILAGIPRNTR